tara:strand:- start:432 stop:713 length:282 start_codon:yes stop_codon:yes gene_type:complete
MSVTTTSKIAYKEINEEGKATVQGVIIFDAVERYGQLKDDGMSLREIEELTGIDINAVSGRVNDLKKGGHLRTIEKRKCTVTNRLISPVVVNV